jgi:hypothetical protein
VKVLQPPGTSASFPAIIADIGGDTAHQAGLEATACHLLLVAHGSSKSSSSRQATEAAQDAVAKEDRFARVHIAFLEEEPWLGRQLNDLPGPLIVIGLFAGEGMHGEEDMAQAMERTNRCDLILAEPLPRSTRFERLIVRDLDIVAC